jgi:hypothetical protein
MTLKWQNFTAQLRNLDKTAIYEILNLMVLRGVTEVDLTNQDDENDEVYAYCFDDNGHSAGNILIKKAKMDINNGVSYLILVDDEGIEHSAMDFHEGTFPYIYNAVFNKLRD